MSTSVIKISVSLFCFHDRFRRFSSTRLISSFQTLEESVRAAVEAKTYQQIPEFMIASKESCINPNPFSSSPLSLNNSEFKSLMKFYNLLYLSDSILTLKLPIPLSHPLKP